MVRFDAKKSTEKKAIFDDETIKAVRVYQESIRAQDDAIMFPPGEGRDPTLKWVKWIQRFFKRHN